MCGIYGFTGTPDTLLLEQMASKLGHRGPDETGMCEHKNFSAGIDRLSIVDPRFGSQPWHTPDGKVSVVCNGEIYNFRELRTLLQALDYPLTSDHSDTEVIPYLYLEYGIDFIHKIDGMFAIALYDHRNEKLFLIRDRVGKKPLYYLHTPEQTFFASEIKALLCCGSSLNVDPDALNDYFMKKNTVAPRSVYKEIRCVEPAHYLCIEGHELRSERYWDIAFTGKGHFSSLDACADALMEHLEEAVIRRLDTDVEYGLFLSGGLDSSLVSAITAKHSSRQLKSFTLTYGESYGNKDDDRVFAANMADRLGTEHFEYKLSAKEVFAQLPKVMQAFDEPFSGTISTYFLSSLIAKHVKVALCGDGADELFGSYLTHRLSPMVEALRAGRTPRGEPEDIEKARQFFQEENSRWRERFLVFTHDELSRLTNTKPKAHPFASADIPGQSELHKTLASEFADQLPNQILTFTDRLSMAHSLEVRSPFLDRRLIDFVAKIPSKWKIHQGEVKYILKRAALKYLPEELVFRKKEGFVLPVYHWIQNDYFVHVKSTILSSAVFDDLGLNRAYAEELLQRFHAKEPLHAKIWSLYTLAVWYKGIENAT